MNKLAISFSGGETSAYMTKLLLDRHRDSDVEVRVTFANTGQENEETLEFVKACDDYFGFNTTWIEAVVDPTPNLGTKSRIVNFETASRNGEPFEAVISKYGIPNMSFPNCSRELKRAAMRSHLESWGRYYTAIGIRADEFDRASIHAKRERLIYPLIELGVTKPDVNRFWSQQPFRLNLKGYQGNCKWCWKKSYRKLMTIATETPEAFDFPRRMEEKYADFRPVNQLNRSLPARFFRQNKTVDDIFKMAEAGFVMAEDDSLNQVVFAQGNLFDSFIEQGVSAGCGESCEAF